MPVEVNECKSVSYMLRAISVKGVKAWNKIHIKVNHDCSFVSFKVALKRYMINNHSLITYMPWKNLFEFMVLINTARRICHCYVGYIPILCY